MYKSLKTLNNFKQWHQTISYFKNKQTLASIVKYKKMMETLKQIFGNLISISTVTGCQGKCCKIEVWFDTQLVMVFNATFNNISAILWQSVL